MEPASHGEDVPQVNTPPPPHVAVEESPPKRPRYIVIHPDQVFSPPDVSTPVEPWPPAEHDYRIMKNLRSLNEEVWKLRRKLEEKEEELKVVKAALKRADEELKRVKFAKDHGVELF